MLAIALYAPERTQRERLRQRLADAAGLVIGGCAETPAALARLIAAGGIDAVVASSDAAELALPAGVALVRLAGEASGEAALAALLSGAQAVLPRSASGEEIAAAVAAAAQGLAVLPRSLLETLLLPERSPVPSRDGDDGEVTLTPRERDILAALADGASNKLIARRLGISFHTVKFHVASILAKLDAETRTEAVARAARLGLVML